MNAETKHESADIARTRAYGFDVPAWAHFVAVDRDGAVWAFACEPVAFRAIGVWAVEGRACRWTRLGDMGPARGWRNSLSGRVRHTCGEEWMGMLGKDSAQRVPSRARAVQRGKRDSGHQAAWRVAFVVVALAGVVFLAHLLGYVP